MADAHRFTAVGAFANRARAEKAIEELLAAGFQPAQIGVAARGGVEALPGAGADLGSKAEEGAAAGAAAGGAFGALAGAVAAGAIPGVGPFIAGGLLAGLIGGTSVGAAAGALVGVLVGRGVPEEEARYYDREFTAGRVIVAVEAEGRSAEAADLLRRCGAHRATAAGGRFDRGETTPAR